MFQLTVPYEEIENRLAICCEFLLDRKKSIEDAYESLMEKLGTKLMEFTKFKYWFERFQNNQFDLGYDTNLDAKEISETQNKMNSGAKEVKNVSTMTIETKASVAIEFNEEDVPENQDCKEISKIQKLMNPEARLRKLQWFRKLRTEAPVEIVPQIFKPLINKQMEDLKEVHLDLDNTLYWLKFGDLHVRFEKKTDNWSVTYNCSESADSTTIETADPEKSIIDHLWFVLKNPHIKLDRLLIKSEGFENRDSQKIDSEQLNTFLQSIFNTFDHQIHVKLFGCEGYNEDTLLSILECIKPEKLETIGFSVLWKEEENYQKLKEIMKTEQWKQAKRIYSVGVTPLKIENLFHYEVFWLEVESITPRDILRVTEHFFNSTDNKHCYLSSKNQNFDINAIIDFLLSQIDGSKIDERSSQSFTISKPMKRVFLNQNGDRITIRNW